MRRRLNQAVIALAGLKLTERSYVLRRFWAWLMQQVDGYDLRFPALLAPEPQWVRPSNPELAARFDEWLRTGERQWVWEE